MRKVLAICALCVAGATSVAASTIVFANLNDWQAASGGWESDNFAGVAMPGTPQASYVSPLGVTLRRSLVREDNGKNRTTTVDYDGNVSINEPGYSYLSSANQVVVYSGGPNGGSFAGPEDTYARRNGYEQTNYTRWPDLARRRIRSDYTNHTSRSTAVVTGTFDDPVTSFGFNYYASASPWPGSLRLEVNDEILSVAVLPYSIGPLFFGVHSTEPITTFRLSLVRGSAVTTSETFTNRPCAGGPLPPNSASEICLSSGSYQQTMATAVSSITEMFVGTPAELLQRSDVATPEPSTAFLVASAFVALAISRRKRCS